MMSETMETTGTQTLVAGRLRPKPNGDVNSADAAAAVAELTSNEAETAPLAAVAALTPVNTPLSKKASAIFTLKKSHGMLLSVGVSLMFIMLVALVAYSMALNSVRPVASFSEDGALVEEPMLTRLVSGIREARLFNSVYSDGTDATTTEDVLEDAAGASATGVVAAAVAPVSEETIFTGGESAEELDLTMPRVLKPPYTLYKNNLARGWEDRSWNTNVNYSGFPAYDGLTAMTVHFADAAGGVYLYSPEAINISDYNVLRFWINGGTAGGQQVAVALVDENEKVLTSVPLTSLYPNNWRQVDIDLKDLDNPEAIRGVMWRETLGAAQPVFFIDEVAFVDDPLAGRFVETELNGPTLVVQTAAEQHDISPHIYGMNFADEAIAGELDMGVNRWGGNAVSRYNYLNDATNTGNNWYYENIPPSDPSPSLPNNSGADQFVQQNDRTETETLMTIPMMGWVARADYACGFSVEKYGEQIETDEWRPDCGGGVRLDGTLIEETDPNDTSIPADPSFIAGWVQHLVGRFGRAEDGGVRFYNLDNEPMIWSHTHRDVRNDPLGTDEFWERSLAYASAVKSADDSAELLGPVFWGWSSYFWSDLDISDDNDPKVSAPDREAHDNLPLAAWYLREFARHEAETGVRLLDYFDLHFYPQAAGVAFNEVGNESVQALRLRSTRSLWDPGYVDESWIAEPVYLIPRMREWIDTYYPDTKIAISEYNWGGLEDINGAVTQADVLGIFGQQGVDLAALWADNTPMDAPGMYAFRMYRNYDQKGGKFGDVSLLADSTNSDQIAIFAARRSEDDALTLIVVNKSSIPMTSELFLADYDGPKSAEVFRYSDQNLTAIERMPNIRFEDDSIIETFPPASITLLVLGDSADG